MKIDGVWRSRAIAARVSGCGCYGLQPLLLDQREIVAKHGY